MKTQNEDSLIAAEYVLGLTNSLARKQLNKRLNEDAAFANDVLRWQKAFSGIDAVTQDVMPSPGLWPLIAHDIEESRSVTKISPTGLRPIHWIGWALAAVLAGVIVFTVEIKPEGSHGSIPIAVLKGTQPDAQFVVSLGKSRSTIHVSSLNVVLPQDKSLQLWLIAGHSAPKSLGIINHRYSNTFTLPSSALNRQTVLAISLEPVGGSRQAGPSGPVIFQGQISEYFPDS